MVVSFSAAFIFSAVRSALEIKKDMRIKSFVSGASGGIGGTFVGRYISKPSIERQGRQVGASPLFFFLRGVSRERQQRAGAQAVKGRP